MIRYFWVEGFASGLGQTNIGPVAFPKAGRLERGILISGPICGFQFVGPARSWTRVLLKM